jgi:hypothetical protein
MEKFFMDFDILFPLIPFLLSPVILGIVIYFALRTASTNKKKLEIMGRELGLETEMAAHMKEFSENNKAQQSLINFVFMLADPVFTGKFAGFPVRINFEKRGGENKTTYTAVTLSFPDPLNTEISLAREGTMGKFANLIGFKDIQVNDLVLDNLLRIKAKDEMTAKTFLLDSRHKDALINIFKKYDDIEFSQIGFRYEEKGYITDSSKIKGIFADMAEAAERMST